MKKEKKLSKQRRWQLKQKAAGMCTICGKPSVDGTTAFCEEHRKKNRHRSFVASRKRAGIPMDIPKHTKYNKRLDKK